MTISELNELFADKLGRIPAGYPQSGEPQFQYKRISDITYIVRDGTEVRQTESGLATVVPKYKRVPQLPDEPDRWCVARWLPPGWAPGEQSNGEITDAMQFTPEQWHEKWGKTLGWPDGGMWIVLTPLKENFEPNERWTRWAIDHLDWQASQSPRETFYAIMDWLDAREKARGNDIVDCLRDCWSNHITGARGGSYLAFNEPPERIQ